MKHPEIPQGYYCYTLVGITANGVKIDPCPYWSRNPDYPEQQNGYCSLLKVGDWDDEGFSLLWDQVKCCGINEEEDIVGMAASNTLNSMQKERHHERKRI